MPQRILVTGAAGFIGSWLVERLLERGDWVVGLDNFDPFYDRASKERNLAVAYAHPSFRFVEGDCTDPARLDQALAQEDFDVVVHLAAKAGVRPSIQDPVGYATANVMGTQIMLEFARRRAIRRFVLASSSSVYGNSRKIPFAETDPVDAPISPYAATKVASEVLCRTHHHLYGMSMVALRFFTVYGPRQRPDLAIRKFATLMLRGEPIPMFGDGTSQRDYTWIDDILAGVLAAIDYTASVRGAFEIINLGGNRTTTLKRLIDLLAHALDREPVVEPHPAQPGDVRRTYADITKAGRLLQYAPTTTIEEGIPRFVAWMLRERPRATQPRMLALR